MKKLFLLSFMLVAFELSIFAKTTYSGGIDINYNDVGLSLTQTTNNFNIKATASYPLFSILRNRDNFTNANLHDYFETYCFHGTINYKIIEYNSLFLNLGLGSDVFMQFDFSNENTHYTCFSVGPYGELGYLLKNKGIEKGFVSFSFNLPLICLENKKTEWFDPSETEGWNEIIDINDAIFDIIFMAYKINIRILL
ncbi:MAG: hypothetical protein ACPKM0_12915 [Pleomorphochaeta sp.]